MAQAKRDNNFVTTMVGVLNTDGTTPTNVKINPTTHILDISDGTSGTDYGNEEAERDDNGVTTLIAVSSSDGTTPVPIYINSSGQLLTKST